MQTIEGRLVKIALVAVVGLTLMTAAVSPVAASTHDDSCDGEEELGVDSCDEDDAYQNPVTGVSVDDAAEEVTGRPVESGTVLESYGSITSKLYPDTVTDGAKKAT